MMRTRHGSARRRQAVSEPFDAVTALWTREGFRMAGRALGRDFWAVTGGSGELASASIEGTVDGLSMTAESTCVG